MSETMNYVLRDPDEAADELGRLRAENAQHLEEIGRLHADIIQLRANDGELYAALDGLHAVIVAYGISPQPGSQAARHLDRAVPFLKTPANAGGPLTQEIEAWAEGVFDNAKEVMPNSGAETRQRPEHNAQPRPAQSPAGAELTEWYEAKKAFLALPPMSFDKNGWIPDENTPARDRAFRRFALAEHRLTEAVAALDSAAPR